MTNFAKIIAGFQIVALFFMYSAPSAFAAPSRTKEARVSASSVSASVDKTSTENRSRSASSGSLSKSAVSAIETDVAFAVNDDSIRVLINESTDIDVLANDRGQDLQIVSVSQPANGFVSFEAIGSVSYTPNRNFTGKDVFSYSVLDADKKTATASVVVNVGNSSILAPYSGSEAANRNNQAPIAVDDDYFVRVGEEITFNVLANDSDPDGDPLRLEAVTAQTNSPHGQVTNWQTNGSVTFQAYELPGTFQFTYKVSSGSAANGNYGFDIGTVTIKVEPRDTTPGNRAPIAVDDLARTTVNSTINIDVLKNDSDPDGDRIYITSVTRPTGGEIVGGDTISQNLILNPIVYRAPTNPGTYTFDYTITDGQLTDTATVTIRVESRDTTPGNQPPVAVDDDYSVIVKETINFNVLANDYDPDGDPLRLEAVTAQTDSLIGRVTSWDKDGNMTFAAGSVAGTFQFTYKVSSGSAANGNYGFDIGTVTIKVEPRDTTPGSCTINLEAKPPTVRSGAPLILGWTVSGDTQGQIRIGSQDDPRAVFNFYTDAVNGQRDGTAPATPGNYTYVAAVNCADGSMPRDTVVVTVIDPSAPNTVVAVDDSYRINRNQTSTFDVLANDYDPQGDRFFLDGILTRANNGVATIVGDRVEYVPNRNFTGTDSFVYRIRDERGATDTAVVTVTVRSSGGGGGSVLPPRDRGEVLGDEDTDLYIFNERLTRISDSRYMVTWNTNIPATSQVAYGMRSVINPGGACGSTLGYQQATNINTNLTTTHVMIVDGLTPGAQYFFRGVSDRADADCVHSRELTERPLVVCEGYLRDFLRLGQYNDPAEVAKLQAFLRIYEGENINISGVFDVATDLAVKRFQVKYYEHVLAPWGYSRDEATGYVYITTRNKINEIICERDIPFTQEQLAEMAAFRAYWANHHPGEVLGAYDKAAGPEALLPRAEADELAMADEDNTQENLITIDDENFFLDNIAVNTEIDETGSATVNDGESGISGRSFAAAAFSGIIGFVFALPFLLFVLGILIGLLAFEFYKSRQDKRARIILTDGEVPAPKK